MYERLSAGVLKALQPQSVYIYIYLSCRITRFNRFYSTPLATAQQICKVRLVRPYIFLRATQYLGRADKLCRATNKFRTSKRDVTRSVISCFTRVHVLKAPINYAGARGGKENGQRTPKTEDFRPINGRRTHERTCTYLL